ncbi:PhoH family protein [Cellvibrio polysaccharolyticus]|uniref:PhoH family protein n=1 Tax=Cellvibrio polysaccharolyticus TaxID=2082724 RepID=A0A928V4M7_9GAMM|nr:PhoH family protein [Cellvibrio polysaccharolyticus]MBE8717125.1 PhoH family protein [Cellvibrio polysaccharolyticus]
MAKRSHARRSTSQGYAEDGNYRGSRHKSSRRHRNDDNIVEINSRSQQIETAYSPPRSPQPLRAKNQAQQDYINAIRHHALTFGIGPAGTGKSYCAGALAAEALESGRIERIILTRPAVETGENLGFLPGDLDQKFSVYIDAFRDILNERLGAGTVDYCLRHGRIVAAPLAFMRGKTFNSKTFVILDEAQNTSVAQMKMFLTRIGEDCKVVINGDIEQSDIRGPNGLADAIQRLDKLASVHIHEFAREDIVRSGLVRDIIDRYELN